MTPSSWTSGGRATPAPEIRRAPEGRTSRHRIAPFGSQAWGAAPTAIGGVFAMKRFVVRLMIGLGALALGATGASAQEGVVMKNILGSIGIIPKDRPKIDYRE